jgi:hypothetical protein
MSDYELVLDACRRGNLTDEEYEKLRKLSLKERGEMIHTLCREAAAAEADRIESGLPPTPREPWPESTWEFLRKCMTQSPSSANENKPSLRGSQGNN